MSKVQFLVSALLLVLLVAACAPKAAPAPAPPAPVPAAAPVPVPTVVPAAPARQAWEIEWDNTLQAARHEGAVMIYTTGGSTVRSALYNGFLNRYGITAEIVGARTEEIPQKILMERRAGLYFVDLAMLTPTSTLPSFKPRAVLDKVEPFLILPEVTDSKMWRQGKLLWLDNDHTVLAGLNYVVVPLLINTDQVRAEEVQSFRDLLNPKWKGKIIADDPVGSTLGGSLWAALGAKIMGWDFVEDLAIKQEVVVSRDWRQQVESVARGKHAMALGFQQETATEFIRLGTPLRRVVPKDGATASSGSGIISIPTRAPHANATKVFVNWFLGKEGQSIATKAYGLPSGRLDASTEGLDPTTIVQPGVNYVYTNNEDWINGAPAFRDKVKEIFSRR